MHRANRTCTMAGREPGECAQGRIANKGVSKGDSQNCRRHCRQRHGGRNPAQLLSCTAIKDLSHGCMYRLCKIYYTKCCTLTAHFAWIATCSLKHCKFRLHNRSRAGTCHIYILARAGIHPLKHRNCHIQASDQIARFQSA